MVPVMPNVRRRTLLGAAAAATLAACDSGPDYPPGPLRIASGGVGGVYYTYAEGMAAVYRDALPGLRPTVLTTPASVEKRRTCEGAGVHALQRVLVAQKMADAAQAELDDVRRLCPSLAP